jgi:Rps23 Pro-64 3,4-dihydroxylase Tpa1-like proline 4-hydroxylase
MKYSFLITTTGDKIRIFDDVFDPQKVYFIHKFLTQSYFQFRSSSTTLQEHSAYIYPSSSFSKEDIVNLSFFEGQNIMHLLDETLTARVLTRCWCNAILEGSKYFWHVDAGAPRDTGDQTMLYYANSNWDKDWQGETLFCNKNGECEIAVAAKPGRIVIFDSGLMHKPVPISSIATTPRYSIVFQFMKQGENLLPCPLE